MPPLLQMTPLLALALPPLTVTGESKIATGLCPARADNCPACWPRLTFNRRPLAVAGGQSSATKSSLGLGSLRSVLLQRPPWKAGWRCRCQSCHQVLTPLGGSDPDTASGLAGGKRVAGGKVSAWQLAGAGGTVPSPTLRLGGETAPRREGQADASIRSDLNLQPVLAVRCHPLCPPKLVSVFPSRGGGVPAGTRQGPHTHSKAGAAGGGGPVKITSPLRGPILLPFVSAKPRGR